MSAPEHSKPLTREQAQAYLRRGGDGCPRCGFDEPWRSAITFEDGVYLQTGECPACALTWHDVAPLTDLVLPNAHGDSVTYSIATLTDDEWAAVRRASDLLGAAGCRDAAAVLQRLLQDSAP